MQTENKPSTRYLDILTAIPKFYRVGNHVRNAGDLPDYTVVAIELMRSGRSAVVTLEYEDETREDILISLIGS